MRETIQKEGAADDDDDGEAKKSEQLLRLRIRGGLPTERMRGRRIIPSWPYAGKSEDQYSRRSSNVIR